MKNDPMPKNVMLAHLKNWRETEEDIFDLFVRYFDSYVDRWDWMEINDEARNLWNKLTHEDVEKNSFADEYMHACIVAGFDGAIKAMAAMLGLDYSSFKSILYEWVDDQDDPPESISLDEVKKRMAEYVASMEKCKNERIS